jgi:mRNA interferase RelE/StbE
VPAYRVEFAPAARRQFEKLPQRVRRQLWDRIVSLGANPRPAGCEKLAGSHALYRIRVGSYRIIYEIAEKRLLVLIVKIGDRKEVYR